MSNSLKNINNHEHNQKTQAKPEQVENNAGGFVFEISPKSIVERFLILGTDGGTYYVGEQKLTESNVEKIKKIISTDEKMVRETMVDVAVNNRAYRVSPTIFMAALLHTYGVDKVALRAVLPKILRTSTHLFEYSEYVKNLGGWGRSKRGAVKDWYENKTDEQLAYQLVKYRQRNGWTHRDLLRISHAQPSDVLARFALGKLDTSGSAGLPAVIEGFQKAQAVTTAVEAVEVLKEFPMLPWEALPTEMHKDVDVWKTIFYNGSLKGSAAVRNVLRLGKLNAFDDLDFAADYAQALSSPEAVAASRLHPLAYLNANVTYANGQKDRDSVYGWSIGRKKTWDAAPMIVAALEAGFYEAFKSVKPSGKRTMIGLDVSGSMSMSANGIDLSCAEVGAVMAMAIARGEEKYLIKGFTAGNDGISDLNISKYDSLSEVMKRTRQNNFGSTDCSLPMQWAEKKGIAIDTFVVITDNETYAGRIHPFEALKKYRKATGIDARLAVMGVAATDFSIADPSDRGMMDFVGFDASAPNLLADFSAGRV